MGGNWALVTMELGGHCQTEMTDLTDAVHRYERKGESRHILRCFLVCILPTSPLDCSFHPPTSPHFTPPHHSLVATMSSIISTSFLHNKTALITGASGGIGAATAILFAKAGANVIISARRASALKDVEKKVKEANLEGKTGMGGKVFSLVMDVGDRKGWDGEF